MATVTSESQGAECTSRACVEVAAQVRAAYEAHRAVFPCGGRTALNYGGPVVAGDELDIAHLNQVVDYTPRDMTIVAEAGVRMAELAKLLEAEGQFLPIDVPRAAEATIGGVVATNWSGPRRLGYGTIRDYVIGIHAVDGRGVAFKGGGRVVKNVAGYDFCKLLTGSLGTLGIVTQLALKVKPLPESAQTVVAACADVATAEILLERLTALPASPVAIDYLLGAEWNVPRGASGRQAEIGEYTPHLVIRTEGTTVETDWLADRVQTELALGGGMNVAILESADAERLWSQQVEFADRGAGEAQDESPLVIKVTVPPSGVTKFVAQLLEFDPQCAIQAHAASGIIIARFTRFGQSDVTRTLVSKLRPAAVKLGGSLVIVSSQLDGLTPHVVWGNRDDGTVLLEQIKRAFDPRNILNPGRFVFH